MWNHRQQRDTSYVISYSFFHITPWYHMWYHGMLIYDITVWYHIVMSYVMSHPWRWLKLPARRLWLPKVQPPRCRQRPEARTPSQHQPPRRGSQRGIPLPVVQKNQTMRKRDFAHWQIDQTRDNLKIGYHFSEIVWWKISTNFRCLTSVEREGDCVGSDVMKCQGNSIGRDILKIEYQFKKSTIMKHL